MLTLFVFPIFDFSGISFLQDNDYYIGVIYNENQEPACTAGRFNDLRINTKGSRVQIAVGISKALKGLFKYPMVLFYTKIITFGVYFFTL